VEKYCRAGHATDDNLAHAHCMLGTSGYTHALGICNNYCFSTEIMVARTRLDCYVVRTLPLLFITELVSIYCSINSESLYKIDAFCL
jgi:hypothetical protein